MSAESPSVWRARCPNQPEMDSFWSELGDAAALVIMFAAKEWIQRHLSAAPARSQRRGSDAGTERGARSRWDCRSLRLCRPGFKRELPQWTMERNGTSAAGCLFHDHAHPGI